MSKVSLAEVDTEVDVAEEAAAEASEATTTKRKTEKEEEATEVAEEAEEAVAGNNTDPELLQLKDKKVLLRKVDKMFTTMVTVHKATASRANPEKNTTLWTDTTELAEAEVDPRDKASEKVTGEMNSSSTRRRLMLLLMLKLLQFKKKNKKK